MYAHRYTYIYIYVYSIMFCWIQQLNYYVGHTQTTLSRRLTMHSGNGAVKDRFQQTHDMTLTGINIVEFIKITRRESR